MQDPCHLAFRENQFFPQRLEYFLNRQHIPVCDRFDYKQLLAVEFSAAEYRVWHEHAVKEFM